MSREVALVDLLTRDSLPIVAANAFWHELSKGHLWVPPDVSDNVADVLAAAVRNREHDNLFVHVNTVNGTQTVWGLAEELTHVAHAEAHIGLHCKSAGLIIACACQHRNCKPHTQFLYHGSPYKNGAADDLRKAKWFAERTTTSEEEWLYMAQSGKDFEFGPERALEMGVVHEVVA